MVRLSEHTKNRIELYVKKGYLEQRIILEIWKDAPRNKIIKTLKTHLSINEITLTKVWLFIIQNIWKDLGSIFDKREIILLRTILLNDGAVLRARLKNNSLNEYMVTKAINSLYERDIIDVLSFRRNEKIIILHPEFRHRIFDDGTNPTEST